MSKPRKTPHPSTTPLEEWPRGWLVLQVASLSGKPEYLLLHDHERRKLGLPVTQHEMQKYIRLRQAP